MTITGGCVDRRAPDGCAPRGTHPHTQRGSARPWPVGPPPHLAHPHRPASVRSWMSEAAPALAPPTRLDLASQRHRQPRPMGPGALTAGPTVDWRAGRVVPGTVRTSGPCASTLGARVGYASSCRRGALRPGMVRDRTGSGPSGLDREARSSAPSRELDQSRCRDSADSSRSARST